eukprot:gb/GECH01012277.1/.p1 GENE.gb/GECH01012277.1/~~gb/GECH01012277.1/.p1  ORF type:complete len:412 (+),score=81.56 gb/GECH01012277.1/:1-1236(+)
MESKLLAVVFLVFLFISLPIKETCGNITNETSSSVHLLSHDESHVILNLLSGLKQQLQKNINNQRSLLENRTSELDQDLNYVQREKSDIQNQIRDLEDKEQRLIGEENSIKKDIKLHNENWDTFEQRNYTINKQIDIIERIRDLLTAEKAWTGYNCEDKECHPGNVCEDNICRLEEGETCKETSECRTGTTCIQEKCQAAHSCREILERDESASSGVYDILNPSATGQKLSVYCDMEFRSGGWMSVYNQPKNSMNARDMYAALKNRKEMSDPLPPSSVSDGISSQSISLSFFTEVVFGWAPAPQSTVTRYAFLESKDGLAGLNVLDKYEGDKTTVGEFTLVPENENLELQTGRDVTDPHVGLGHKDQQILWGIDRSGNDPRWANLRLRSCCYAGRTDDMDDDQWRYVIYVR